MISLDVVAMFKPGYRSQMICWQGFGQDISILRLISRHDLNHYEVKESRVMLKNGPIFTWFDFCAKLMRPHGAIDTYAKLMRPHDAIDIYAKLMRPHDAIDIYAKLMRPHDALIQESQTFPGDF
jgi:hypothetical protein